MFDGLVPPKTTPLVELLDAPIAFLAFVKSQKSDALPCDDGVK